MPAPAPHAAQTCRSVRPGTPGWVLAPLLGMVLALPSAASADRPHQHGTVKLDVVVEGDRLTLALDAPLDNLLGFERAPRSEAERRAAADVLARLRAGAALFSPDAAAQCTLRQTEVSAPVLAPGAQGGAQGGGQGGQGGQGGHADLQASYQFNCVMPQQLRRLGLGLFDAFPRIQRITVQVAGPQGQHSSTLKRPARSVPLAK
jgi:Protein of unknown function (DUF2796)